MKKLIYICLALVLTTLLACRDENYECFDPTTGSDLPEKAAAGEYPGSFTRISSGDTASAQGVISIAPSDTAYCANITFTSQEFNLNTTVRLNFIGRNNGSYAFETNDITNQIGSKILGTIDAQGNLWATFVYKQRSGRKTVKFDYSFLGKKQ